MEPEQVPVPRESADDPAVLEEAVYGDEALAGRPVGLDPHDFAALYVRHRASFAGLARRFLRDPRDVDEVVQEAFLKLFLAMPELGTELQAIAYCRRTITNLCIDRYRQDQRRPRMLGLDSAPAEVLLEDEPADPVVQAEDAALVREALARLQPLHREALVKREIEEKPLPVIAQELEVPEESVKHLLFRARRALRRLLAGSTADPAALVRIAAGSGGKLGVLIALVVLGLGSGPDLRVVPVVGKDLPDLPSVAEVVVETIPELVQPPKPAPAARVVEEPAVQVPLAPAAKPSPVVVPGPDDASSASVPRVQPQPSAAASTAPSTAASAAPTPTASAAEAGPTASPTPGADKPPLLGEGLEPTAQPSAQVTGKPSPQPSAEADKPRPGTQVVGGTPTAQPTQEPTAEPTQESSPEPTPSRASSSPAPSKAAPASGPSVFPGRLQDGSGS